MELIPLENITMELADVAMGRRKAHMVIKNGTLVNVNTKELQEHCDVAIYKGRIALVGDASHCIDSTTEIIDATGLYIAPGFMDGHIHVESSMLTVSQYSSAVVPHGTTAIFMDPHEIANVLGLKGVKLMLDEAKDVPLRVFATVPSCVPAAPGLEDAGSVIGPDEIAEAMKWDGIAGLGELMNFPGVFNSVPAVHKEIEVTLKAGKPVTGHFALPDTGAMLNAYVASGVRSCHESVRAQDALAKMRLGMYAKIREGSAWHDLKEVIKAVTHHKVNSRFAVLVSDDTHPETLISHGHLDYIVKRAIEEGVDPITAIEMVTINTAECFMMSKDFGSVSPSKVADIVLLSDLYKVSVAAVIIGGNLVAKEGKMLIPTKSITYPDWSKNTVNVGKVLHKDDFILQSNKKQVKVRVIQIQEASVITKQSTETLNVVDGNIAPDTTKDIAKAALFERHKATGTKGIGFVKGFGFIKGAVASTVAHDSHNLLIVGTNEEDMAFAGNELIKAGGGMIAVANGTVLAIVELPVAGLLSDEPVEVVQKKVEKLQQAWKDLGCTLVSPFMTMALLGLPVIPELRLSNRGLVDAINFAFVDVVAE
ncbi:MAG: adenine deaminase [Spirochaetes bacterium]|nr:adenine deaminase [Spirochaetota bacterium]